MSKTTLVTTGFILVTGMVLSASTIGQIGFSPTAGVLPTVNNADIGLASEITFHNGADTIRGNEIDSNTGDFTVDTQYPGYFDTLDYNYFVDFSSALTGGFTFTPGLSSGSWNNLIVFGKGSGNAADPTNIYSFNADEVYVVQTAPANSSPGSLSLEFFGTFSDSTHTLSSNTASLSLTPTQTVAGGIVNYSATFAIPGSQPPNLNAPEPAAVAMIGLGLIGLATIRRKKA